MRVLTLPHFLFQGEAKRLRLLVHDNRLIDARKPNDNSRNDDNYVLVASLPKFVTSPAKIHLDHRARGYFHILLVTMTTRMVGEPATLG